MTESKKEATRSFPLMSPITSTECSAPATAPPPVAAAAPANAAASWRCGERNVGNVAQEGRREERRTPLNRAEDVVHHRLEIAARHLERPLQTHAELRPERGNVGRVWRGAGRPKEGVDSKRAGRYTNISQRRERVVKARSGAVALRFISLTGRLMIACLDEVDDVRANLVSRLMGQSCLDQPARRTTLIEEARPERRVSVAEAPGAGWAGCE